ncbi:MAG TPA: penicillin-binding transpeptidase domain-containing protein [Gaiellaceae bacterium]|nr:penicillin-binding transpeptidase domain-containing protein [Gaiellaceae bacterium]
MRWGHRRRRAVIRRPRRAHFGDAGEWASVRRRRRRPAARTAPLVVTPPLTAEPVAVAEAEFVHRPAFHVRVAALGLIAMSLFAVLLLRLWSLELIQGRQLAHVAQAQSFRTVYLPAPRGAIVDRSGRLLAGTTGRVVITADAHALGRADSHGLWKPSSDGWQSLRRLARVARTPARQILANIRRSVRRSPFASAVALPRPSRALTFYLDERADTFRGFRTAVVPVRWYPRGAIGSEFLGLLGEVDARQLHEPSYAGARLGQIVGRSGVEATYERALDGGLQRARVRVDARGNIVGQLHTVPTKLRAKSLQLSVDLRVQRAAMRAIQHGIAFAHRAGHPDADAGAAVVMNPWNGEIYALATYPTFDEQRAAKDPSYYLALSRRSASPLLNRATQGLYPTGSTFKPIVAEAALATHLITRWSSIPCTGSLTVGNIVFHNVEPAINANLNLDQALAISCDTWFYRLGTMFYARQASTGALDMQRWAHLLGLGHPTGVDLPGEYGGVVPTPAWLRRTFSDPLQRIWYEGYSVNLSIGQGYLAVTPLQLAVAYSALANGGKVVRPHVAHAIFSRSGAVRRLLHFAPRRRLQLTDVEAIRNGLYDAAHAADGTSAAIFGSYPVPVAGKTGTAETPTGSDHSWYASWAPAGNPRVVVVVLIEHGGFGVEAAAPAAREIYSSYFHVR